MIISSLETSELIDTLWNVNKTAHIKNKKSDPRINRYIMECKCIPFQNFCTVASLELIDTLWNVNANVVITVEDKAIGINRYIMECKLSCFPHAPASFMN